MSSNDYIQCFIFDGYIFYFILITSSDKVLTYVMFFSNMIVMAVKSDECYKHDCETKIAAG